MNDLDPARWTDEAIKEIRKRLSARPNSFLVAYAIYVFDPETKGIDVSANFIGDGHQELGAETESQIMEASHRFTEDVKKIFGIADFNPVEAWKGAGKKGHQD